MKLDAFKPFFSFPEPLWSPKVVYGLTHFYNRARTYMDWNSFSIIRPASELHGELILGQIPITSFRELLVKKLFGTGLVVSCNDNFELSGVGALCNIIPPHVWSYYGIHHHHLPFTDFASNADPHLVIQTLETMAAVFYNKGSIYIHCKAGRSRSALIIALFLCVNEESIRQSLLLTVDDNQLKIILINTIKQVQKLRSQVSVDSNKLTLGVEVLKYYIQHWKKNESPIDLVSLPEKEQINLNASETLNRIAQSDEYKFVWDQAYKNPSIFPIVKSFSENLYSYIEENKTNTFIIDNLIGIVLQDMNKKTQEVILELHRLYLESELFIKEINKYSNSIQNLGLDLFYKILKSNITYTEKTTWLKKISSFLHDPSPEQFEKYNKEIHAALIHPSLSLQIIGGAMITLGVAVIMVSLVASALASGGLFGIALATIAASGFGAFQVLIGKLLFDHGSSDRIARAAKVLVEGVMDRDNVEEESEAPSMFV